MLNVLLLVTEIELKLLDLFFWKKKNTHGFVPFMDKYIFISVTSSRKQLKL